MLQPVLLEYASSRRLRGVDRASSGTIVLDA